MKMPEDMLVISYITPAIKRPEHPRQRMPGLTTRTSIVLAMAPANLRKRVRAYKTELKPTRAQAAEFDAWCECARRVYNMALCQRRDWYEKTGESISAYDQMASLTRLKKLPEFSWLHIPPRRVIDNAVFNLDAAYKNFFRRVKSGGKPGFPKLKRREWTPAFTVHGPQVAVNPNAVRLPNLGWVALKEKDYIPFDAKRLECTITRRAGRWFVSVIVEDYIHERTPAGDPVGVDLGIKHMVALDDGTTIANPKPLSTYQRRLNRLQRKLSRQKKGSSNRQATKGRIARTHYKIACIRSDALHKASSHIIGRDPSVVVVEDLNVSGMMKNGHLARAISDVGMNELRRQIEYKADWNGTEVIVADRWFASSKTCSGCGHVDSELKLSDRTYICTNCGIEIDRDVNAAIAPSLRICSTASCTPN